jgi:GntR family transcriptional regulator
VLREGILSGRWPSGGRLPSERALAEELGVGRTVLRGALTELAQEGLIEPSAQRGWFVTWERMDEGPNALRGFSESALERGLVPGARVLGVHRRAATIDEAETLGLAPASEVVEVERLRTLDGVPVAVHSVTVVGRLVAGLEQRVVENGSLYDLLLGEYGIVPARCDYTLQAEAATTRIAELLDIDRGAPVLVGVELTFDRQERAISHGRIVYRGDAYRFKASLFR